MPTSVVAVAPVRVAATTANPSPMARGLKPSEIIAAGPELLALIAEYQRDKRKEADDGRLREAEQ